MNQITPNLLAETDALVLLERIKTESIDLVYLDPMWNTSEEDEEDFLELMWKVLQQAHRVLKETGAVFFYSHPSLNLNIQPLITRIFSAANHQADFIVPDNIHSRSSRFSNRHSTLLCYGKTEMFSFGKINRSKEEIERLYPKIDDRGQYRTLPLHTGFKGDGQHRFKGNSKWRDFQLGKGAFWRYSIEKLEQLVEENSVEFREGRFPVLKRYFAEEDGYKNIGTIWNDILMFPFFKSKFFSTEKSADFADRILSIGSKEGDVILDPFCGAGSLLEVATNKNRKWIAGDITNKAISICDERLEGDYELKHQHDIEKIPIEWNNYLTLIETIEDEVWQLIEAGESRMVEFKESAAWNYRTEKSDKKNQTPPVLKAIVSFLNSEDGGTLLIGVRDEDKQLVDLRKGDYGAASPKNNQDKYELYLTDKIKDAIGSHIVDNCQISFHEINDCEICMIKVKPSSRLTFIDNQFYIRNGNRKMKLNNEEFFEFIKRRFDLV